jgi:formylglycine-generating enzyme required for sulfatase activity
MSEPQGQTPPATSLDELFQRWKELRGQGKEVSPEDLCAGHPELFEDLRNRIRALANMEDFLGVGAEPPHADSYQAAVSSKTSDDLPEPAAGSRPSCLTVADVPRDLPPRVGRYRVVGLLGEGGFGRVYLAHDDELDRPVAVKVPNRQRMGRPEDVQAYLDEARVLAGLDHPNIVPVYDLGRTDDGSCFVVSKLVEGCDLAARLKQGHLPHAEAAQLVAAVADALHHAHRKGLVHRDIKPANLLIAPDGKPYVADFGLALKEVDFGKGGGLGGTPLYMSPEQARGEGHRVDGRSDIFSLGVVFYELLVGRRPFKGSSCEEVWTNILAADVRPPRQVDDGIPRELERICLKALAKRASERYTTAKDLAEDLRHFLTQATFAPTGPAAGGPAAAPTGLPDELVVVTPTTGPPGALRVRTDSGWEALKVVPKGLRSFDAQDADFFLELLPGPRDRDGLPDSIRFWKARLEETNDDQTFPVGLIYGPSGCGKSSLVKAGLLPRLAAHVHPVYVEAAAGQTEARLLRALRKACPEAPAGADLAETLAGLRRGQGREQGHKVLLVLDQFEQWLHARRGEEGAGLVQALRQCDGGRVQCLLLVRDDFWMAVTRFLHDLEVPLVEGQNSAAADLFDPDHARKVLAAFGRAFDKLPENPGRAGPDQKEFLTQAAAGLAQDGKVVCVRLALFAEMMKHKPWTPATLKEVGGIHGVGVTFLEETFSASTAPPEHRYHQQAARAVLKALAPEGGTALKGHMRAHAELLEASGYAARPKDFEELLRILDTELRLITPADPEGDDARPGPQCYQLAHDYLVPALRQWLTRKQQETRCGRAELRLAERAALWQARPERRHLPSLLEWAGIRLWTRRQDWTEPQRRMMRRAGRHYALRGLALAGLLLAVSVAGLWLWRRAEEQRRADRAEHLVAQLLVADMAQVPKCLQDLGPYQDQVKPRLRDVAAQAAGPQDKLRAAMALLPADPSQADYLTDQLLRAPPDTFLVLRDVLANTHQDRARTKALWAVLADDRRDGEERFRAACALALYDRDSPRWARQARFVANELVPHSLKARLWVDILRPVKDKLVDPLTALSRNSSLWVTERVLAAAIAADYASDRPRVLVGLLLGAADDKEFGTLFPTVRDHRERGQVLELLRAEVTHPPPAADKERAAKRQANAGVALLRLDPGQADTVWPLLRYSPDPRVRTWLLHRIAPLGADPALVLGRLGKSLGRELEPSERRALLLCLGEFGDKALPPAERAKLVPDLLAAYRDDPDPGLHGALAWLLRRWGAAGALGKIDQGLATGKVEGARRWYVDRHGQAFVVIAGDKFLMGSPPNEAGRNPPLEQQTLTTIPRTFALATTDVTVAQWQRFLQSKPALKPNPMWSAKDRADDPQVWVSWYHVAAYCNWLSQEHGIPKDQWCYLPNKEGKYDVGMRPAPDYLHRTGYRLPTDAEWEYACRAGAATSRPYGDSLDLLGRYAWVLPDSDDHPHRVSGLLPNDLGLFDMLGNVWQWTQNPLDPSPKLPAGQAREDREGSLEVDPEKARVIRGGCFGNGTIYARSACRSPNRPGFPFRFIGFRVARTIRPDAARATTDQEKKD